MALLPADAGDLALLAAEGRAVLDDPSSTDADFCAATGVLRAKIAATVEAGQGTAQESALDALIMDHSERILMEDRAWCVPLGFELRPDDLPRPDWDK